MKHHLILHIGIPKTGTSSLQTFFDLNRNLLVQKGMCFPKFSGRYLFAKGSSVLWDTAQRNAFFLLEYGKQKISPQDALPENTKAALLDMQTFRRYTDSCKATLLTHESLYQFASDHEDGFWEAIKEYLDDCGVDRVRIVLYLRRQDQFISSMWRQSVKGGWCLKPFAEYAVSERMRARMDYDRQLSRLEACFGKENIIVRRYDRNLFVGGDIYHDFCEAVGIDWSDDFVLPRQERNLSLTCEAAEIKRMMNLSMARSGNQFQSDRFFRNQIWTYSRTHPEAAHTSPMSSQEAADLLARYEDGNRRIAERYFGGESLFPGEIKSGPVWERDPEALLEHAVDFLTRTLVAEHARAERLEHFLFIPWLRKVKCALTGLWSGR